MTEYTPQAAAAAASPAVEETPACMSEAIYKRLKNNIDINNGDEIEQVFVNFGCTNAKFAIYHKFI